MRRFFLLLVTVMLAAALASCTSVKEEARSGSSSAEAGQMAEETAGKESDKTETDEKTEDSEAADSAQSDAENPLDNQVPIEIEMENGGIIKAVVYPDIAPKTVENFLKLCRENFYDGLIFHRVIKGFMIQGGGFDENMQQKPADSIEGEFKSNGFKNRLKHTRGVLSMARTGDPDSASSQFFIMHAAAPHLDGEYAAFGIVTDGMDVVDGIANSKTVTKDGFEDVPEQVQKIKTIRVME